MKICNVSFEHFYVIKPETTESGGILKLNLDGTDLKVNIL